MISTHTIHSELSVLLEEENKGTCENSRKFHVSAKIFVDGRVKKYVFSVIIIYRSDV